MIREMVACDPERLGSRGSHRYAFANAPAHFGCSDAWACLIDNPVALVVLEAIFESLEFCCSGFGGDFVLPGSYSLPVDTSSNVDCATIDSHLPIASFQVPWNSSTFIATWETICMTLQGGSTT